MEPLNDAVSETGTAPLPGDQSSVLTAARAADAKGGEDTVVLAVGPVLAIVDHFVITSAGNRRLQEAVTEEVERRVAEVAGERPVRTEGLDGSGWALLDYGHFIVHVFLTETREFYDLERLWADVAQLSWGESS